MQKLKDQLSPLFLPLSVLVLLIIINLIKGADYFSITIVNGAFYGNIPNILFGASELVVLSIGMTLVTAASQGQDISIGVGATITSSVFVLYVLHAYEVTLLTIVAGFLISCAAGLGDRRFQRHPCRGIQGSAYGCDPYTADGGQVHRIYD